MKHHIDACLISAGTLGFYLNGVAHPNGSTVLRTDIGEGDAALQCTTDSTTCCTDDPSQTRAGEFYFPDNQMVPILGSVTNGYYRNRSSQSIHLNRQSGGTVTGQFRCEIPTADGTTVNLFINIGTYRTLYSLANTTFIFFCTTYSFSN